MTGAIAWLLRHSKAKVRRQKSDRDFNCRTHTGSPRAWCGERLIAERGKGLHRKIIIKVTPSRDMDIKNQVERFTSARIMLGVGVQRHISN